MDNSEGDHGCDGDVDKDGENHPHDCKLGTWPDWVRDSYNTENGEGWVVESHIRIEVGQNLKSTQSQLEGLTHRWKRGTQ